MRRECGGQCSGRQNMPGPTIQVRLRVVHGTGAWGDAALRAVLEHWLRLDWSDIEVSSDLLQNETAQVYTQPQFEERDGLS